MLEVKELRTEYLMNPLGLDARHPRLSWKLYSDGSNVLQQAYQIQTSSDHEFTGLVWDSGKQDSDQSHAVAYHGPTLSSLERVYWRVKVWCNDGQQSNYSPIAYFETGLLEQQDWQASWIEPEIEVDIDAYKPASYLRKQFKVSTGLRSARACLTAKGLYSFFINGKLGSEDLFTPGFTSYLKRLQYQVYDITALLQEGDNALGVILADGWWRGNTGGANLKNNFGYKTAFLGQLVLEYEDGHREIIGSDGSFKTSYGPLLKSDMKAGEIYDARLSLVGWNEPAYDDKAWRPVQVTGDGVTQLIATRSVPVRQKERFKPTVLRTPNGETVLDFGQNFAGWVEFHVEGAAGSEVVLLHGEALKADGNFTLENLAMQDGITADFQEVRYILRGQGMENYRPQFAIFGFRYVLVKSYPGKVLPEHFTGVAVYSVLEETGEFTCSHPLINQLVSNARWSQKSNFMEVPTDCPTRERAAWTGDAQLYAKTAAEFMNVYPFYEKWMADLASEQCDDGSVGSTVPTVFSYHNLEEWERFASNNKDPMMAMRRPKPGTASMLDGSVGWGDAAVIIPWTMYLSYGDHHILEQQYASAKAWVEYMAANAKVTNEEFKDAPYYHNYTDGELDADYIWDTKFHYGEWNESDFHTDNMMVAMMNARPTIPYVATAYYAYSTRMVADMAKVLGRLEDAEFYGARYEKIKSIYNKYFIRDDGSILEGRQASNVRVLAFELACESKKQAVADHLAKLVMERDYHLNTGFLSTPFLLPVLAQHGYVDIAFRLLEQESFPSWLFAVKKGATTIWENWSGMTPEGELTGSLNHYAYGAVCDFLFSGVAGIQPVWEKPGYKHIVLKPILGGTLTHASAQYESVYGMIRSSWKKTERSVQYAFEIPVNTTAAIILCAEETALAQVQQQFPNASYRDGHIYVEVGSGQYSIHI